jgi:hypothetical protein
MRQTKLRPQKYCSEQFYTDLRWSISAWLLQQRFDTHDKTSLGAPNRRFAIPQADWHLSLGVGHNEHLLHHRCGGRDHSSRRFFGPASIGKLQALLAGGPFRTRHGRTASSFRILGCGSRSMRTSLPQTSSLYGRLVAFARPSG